jgi:hypothetical protein
VIQVISVSKLVIGDLKMQGVIVLSLFVAPQLGSSSCASTSVVPFPISPQ